MRVIAYFYHDPLLEPIAVAISQVSHDPIGDHPLDRVYQDFATSATDSAKTDSAKTDLARTDRCQWQQLLHDCAIEPADYLVLQRWADLGNTLEQVGDRLTQLQALGIQPILLTGEAQSGAITAAKTLTAADLEASQHLQHSQRSQRIRQGHARNRIKTLAPPGKAPYGYQRSKNRYRLDRSTAPVVKAFFDRFLLYGSLRGAVRYLEQKYGKKISVSTGRHWLSNPAYRGDLAYQTGEVIADTHAAILSREEAAQVDRLLRRNRRLPPRTASAPRSLAGLVQCQSCQSPMTVTRVTGNRRRKAAKDYLYLRPTQCPNQPACGAIAYDELLEATIDRICDELPKAVAATGFPDLNAIKAGINQAIAAQQAILEQIPQLLEQGIFDPTTADLRAYTLRSQIAQLQAQLAQLPPVNLRAIAQTGSIPQFWRDLSESERRFYFREFLRHIELGRTDTDWDLTLKFIF